MEHDAVQVLAVALLDEVERRAAGAGLNEPNVAYAVWRNLTREFLESGSGIQGLVNDLFELRPIEQIHDVRGTSPPKSIIERSMIAVVSAEALIFELEQRARDLGIHPGELGGAMWDQLTEQFLLRGMPTSDLAERLRHLSDQIKNSDGKPDTKN